MNIRIKRVYEKPAAADGQRVLVDRIWPRGLTKKAARLDWWPRDIAPTSSLRQWFGHDPEKWDEFRKRYFQELDSREKLIEELRKMAAAETLTLVFGARDEEHNNAAALKEYLEGT